MDKDIKLLLGYIKFGSALHNSLTYTTHILFYIRINLKKSALGWSAICECGISWSYSITFCNLLGSFTFILQFSDFYQWYIMIKVQSTS